MWDCSFLCPPHEVSIIYLNTELKNDLRRLGFPESSAGKESACNVGDPSSIPGSGRSLGEGIGYTLQYSWASPVAQLVKNPPARQETWAQSLGCKDPLEQGKGYPTGLENSMDCVGQGVTKSWT